MRHHRFRSIAGSLLSAALALAAGCRSKDSGLSRLTEGSPAGAPPAAPAFTAVQNPANGHYYALFINDNAAPMLFEDAKDRAASVGGYLATITSEEENNFVRDSFLVDGNIFTFLGALQAPGSQEPDGGWYWDNGEPWSYTNWSFGEPNNSSPLGYEDNVEIYLFDDYRRGRWNDIPNTTQDLGGICNSYLVEWDADPNGDTEPPVIVALSASPAELWPPNHTLRNVTVTAVLRDDRDPAPTYRIVDVSSNQPANGSGDGDASPDWILSGDHNVQLRAERFGNLGDRVYTLTIEAADNAGNKATTAVTVKVPRSK